MTTLADLSQALVGGRDCGNCRVCCVLPAIDTPKLRKPADSVCPHHTGSACGIYAARPAVCRSFFCLWRRLDGWTDAARPDRVGVMFVLRQDPGAASPFERRYIYGWSLGGNEAFARPAAWALVHDLMVLDIAPVWIGAAGKRALIHPRPELAAAIVNPIGADPALAPQVGAWRRRLRLA